METASATFTTEPAATSTPDHSPNPRPTPRQPRRTKQPSLYPETILPVRTPAASGAEADSDTTNNNRLL
ncbi:hypothetical protein BGZ89_005928, partial [Linnemannia elongata]